MQVSKWGKSFAIRLLDAVVEALNLKAGDQVEVGIASERKAIERIRRLRRPLPAGFKFDRLDANER